MLYVDLYTHIIVLAYTLVVIPIFTTLLHIERQEVAHHAGIEASVELRVSIPCSTPNYIFYGKDTTKGS